MIMTDLLTYDIKNGTNRTAEEEWKPHQPLSEKFIEWHYLTAEMNGSNGHRYFGFFCDFNMTSDRYINEMVNPAMKAMGVEDFEVPESHAVHMLQSVLIDCETNEKYTVMEATTMHVDDFYDYDKNELQYKSDKSALNFAFKGDKVTLGLNAERYGVELNCTSIQEPMWAQDKLDVKGLIQEGAPSDFSLYYSLTNLPFYGTLILKDENGKEEKIEVTGRGWIDRQWGDFMTKAWEWSSMRFADGDRINLYNFQGGYQVGTYQHADGSCEYFDSFTVIQNGYSKTDSGTWFSYGWSFKLPVKDGTYTVIPYTDKSTIEAIGNNFYEGLGRLVDENGKDVGLCVNETMDTRVMNNGPYQTFQFNE